MENNTTSWNDGYLLHIPIIDEQHKGFFLIYDELTKLDPATATGEQKFAIVEKLIEYLVHHFQMEEKLMQEAGYPDIEKHREEHLLFISKVNEFKRAFQYKNPVLLNQMIVFMQKWFLSHISETDARYKKDVTDFLNNENV